MKRHELTAWLGDDHTLTEDQFTDLLWQADEIEAHYPDPDDHDERAAALTVAYQLIAGSGDVVGDLAAALADARTRQLRALAGLERAAIITIPAAETESGFARRAGVDRMTVRKWLGK